MKKELQNLCGQVYGRWRVLWRCLDQPARTRMYVCNCECGLLREVRAEHLLRGLSTSCGCHRSERLRLPGTEAAFRSIKRAYINRARQRGQKFSLTDEQFRALINAPLCSYCHTTVTRPAGSRRKKNGEPYNPAMNFLGLDRFDNSRGYEIGNVCACCWSCNRKKSSLPVKVFLDRLAAQQAANYQLQLKQKE